MSDATQSDKKSSSKLKKSRAKAEPAPVSPAVPEPVQATATDAVVPAEQPVQSSARKRREQKAQYLTDLAKELAEMKAKIEEEIESRKRLADNKGNKGIKFLKSMNKRTKKCATILNRVNKTKKNRRNGNTKSGFSIPVEISPEMSKFAGWTEGEHKSRVDVTRAICDYIRVHKLQKESDRRFILPDETLAKLLNFSAKDGKDLTYYSLQQLIQPHFPKKKVVEAPVAPAPTQPPVTVSA